MFCRWRRLDPQDRARVWRLYGWFSGLMTCGSGVGAATWIARMMSYVHMFQGGSDASTSQSWHHLAQTYRFMSIFLVAYAIEFTCLTTALLMVLDRMSVFSLPQSPLERRPLQLWAAAGRAVMAVVVLGNSIGLVANAAAASLYQQAAGNAIDASQFYAANMTERAEASKLKASECAASGGSLSSVQSFCEVVLLVLIVVVFVVVGLLSIKRIAGKLHFVHAESAAAETGRVLRLQISGTSACVFAAFVLRALFSAFVAFIFQFRDSYSSCGGGVCDSCQNIFFHMSVWFNFTPEFQMTVVLISSPVTLLVALWGMTTPATLLLMQKRRDQEMMIGVR